MYSNPRQFTAITIKSGPPRSTNTIWSPFLRSVSGHQSQIGRDDEEKTPRPSQELKPRVLESEEF